MQQAAGDTDGAAVRFEGTSDRQRAGLSVADLAVRTGIAIERLRAIEAGRIDGTAQERRRIAAAMTVKEMTPAGRGFSGVHTEAE